MVHAQNRNIEYNTYLEGALTLVDLDALSSLQTPTSGGPEHCCRARHIPGWTTSGTLNATHIHTRHTVEVLFLLCKGDHCIVGGKLLRSRKRGRILC